MRKKPRARNAASLNHPNIAAIYGFEESTGVHALVLELIEGPTLAERIAQGPIPLDEAGLVGWTVQVVDDTASLWCGRLVPPASEGTLGPGARRETMTKGFYFNVEVNSPTATAQLTKALVDKIAARLP